MSCQQVVEAAVAVARKAAATEAVAGVCSGGGVAAACKLWVNLIL